MVQLQLHICYGRQKAVLLIKQHQVSLRQAWLLSNANVLHRYLLKLAYTYITVMLFVTLPFCRTIGYRFVLLYTTIL